LNKFQKGELVFIPSSVRLIQFSNQAVGLPLFVSKHTTTNKPSNALLLDSHEKYCKILYNGEYWFANKEDIYEEKL